MAGSDLKRTKPALESLAAGFGFTMVDAEITREGGSRYLRIYIDKPGGITLDDCEIYHRAVSAIVEPLDYDFLEVGSPGLDRPLKTQRDFDRHRGETVELRLYKPQDGQKAFEGTLEGFSDSRISLRLGGETRAFSLPDVAVCKPVILVTEEELERQAAQEEAEQGEE